MKGPVAVIIGSGFSGTEEELDYFGFCRTLKAAELYRKRAIESIIITGATYHPSGCSFVDAARAVLRKVGVREESIFCVENPRDFSASTGGDIDQALCVIAGNSYAGEVAFITELPHWFFRVRKILRQKGVNGRFTKSSAASLGYWLKEMSAYFMGSAG